MQITKHASIRIQQRGIPPWFVDLLVAHGKTSHDGHGALLKSIDKDTRLLLQATLSRTQYARAERYFDVYAVVGSDESVITAAHRTKRRFH